VDFQINNERIVGAQGALLWCEKQLKEKQHSQEILDLIAFLQLWVDDAETIEIKTSGSTGEPKVISVKKSAMRLSAQKTLRFFHLKAQQTAILAMSTNYVAGKMMVVRAIEGGLNLLTLPVVSNPFEKKAVEADFLALVPLQVQTALEQNSSVFSQVKTLIIGGGTISYELKKLLFHNEVNAWETFGMTETLSHIALRPVELDVKKPFELIEGVMINKDERGCLVVNAPGICDDLIVTNDIIDIQDKTHFFWLGRFDNVINTGGVKVFPEAIEAKLQSQIDVEYCVLGVPDARLGQKVTLVLEGENVPDDLSEKLSSLNKYEKIRRVEYVNHFPRTETGKIQRGKLLEKVLNKK